MGRYLGVYQSNAGSASTRPHPSFSHNLKAVTKRPQRQSDWATGSLVQGRAASASKPHLTHDYPPSPPGPRVDLDSCFPLPDLPFHPIRLSSTIFGTTLGRRFARRLRTSIHPPTVIIQLDPTLVAAPHLGPRPHTPPHLCLFSPSEARILSNL